MPAGGACFRISLAAPSPLHGWLNAAFRSNRCTANPDARRWPQLGAFRYRVLCEGERMTETRSALVIDDERDIRELLVMTLGRMGLRCDTAATLSDARAQLAAHPYDLCLTDMRLPDGSGMDLVSEISQKHPEHPGGDDHRLRQRRSRGRGPEGRRLRLRRQARRPAGAARPGPPRARPAREAPHQRRTTAIRSRTASTATRRRSRPCARPSPRSPAARPRSTSPANPASARNSSPAPSTSRARAPTARSCRSTAARSRPS